MVPKHFDHIRKSAFEVDIISPFLKQQNNFPLLPYSSSSKQQKSRQNKPNIDSVFCCLSKIGDNFDEN